MAEQFPAGEPWERQALERVALAAIREQRATRRWGMVFKLLLLLYLFALLFIGMGWMGQARRYAQR